VRRKDIEETKEARGKKEERRTKKCLKERAY
jgi:hypothetical protein